MARNLNKVMLIGRLTHDPEVRTTPNGQTVATFSVATSRQWKDAQGAPQSQTEFHNIVAWRKLAEISQQYLNKGKQIYVEGYLQTRSWVGQQDNIKRYRTEVVADNIIFLGSPTGTTQAAHAQTSTEEGEEFPQTPAAPTEIPATPAQPIAPPSAPAEEEIRIEDIPF
jgi:single-strand DNA-binding protein